MKKTVSFVCVLLVSIAMMSLVGFHDAAAYGGGGGDDQTDSTSASSTSDNTVNVSIPFPQNIHVSWAEETPAPVKLTNYEHSQFGNNVVKSNLHTAAEWTESIGDVSTGTSQLGIYGYAAYCWYVGGTVVLVPVSICWQGPKHTTRTIYGLWTGNLDTVYEVNSRSFNGRIVNRVLIEALINRQRVNRGLPPKFPGPNRTHSPERDITHFRGVK